MYYQRTTTYLTLSEVSPHSNDLDADLDRMRPKVKLFLTPQGWRTSPGTLWKWR